MQGVHLMMNMPGRDDHGFVDISATALNTAIRGSILADPDACLVIIMALPFGAAGREPRTIADGMSERHNHAVRTPHSCVI